MKPDHLVVELQRRAALALDKMDAAAAHVRRITDSIKKTGRYSDATQELEARLAKLTDDYHSALVDMTSLRQVYDVRQKCRAQMPKKSEKGGTPEENPLMIPGG